MPWTIVRKGSGYCVQNKETGAHEGCHNNKKDAVVQQRALYSSHGQDKTSTKS